MSGVLSEPEHSSIPKPISQINIPRVTWVSTEFWESKLSDTFLAGRRQVVFRIY